MKKKILSLVSAGIIATTLMGCSNNSGDVATVNGKGISGAEYEQTLDFAKYSIESMYGDKIWDTKVGDGKTVKDQFQDDLINQITDSKILVQEAEKQKVTVKDADVDKAYDSMIKNINSNEDAKKAYDAYKFKPEFIKEQIKDNMLINKLKENIGSKIKISDKEISAYYEKNKDKFKKDQVDASHILIKTVDDKGKELPKDKQDAAKKKIDNIKTQLDNGADFAKLAKENSEDPGSAKNGGELGAFSKGQMVPEFEKAAFNLKEGETSAVVKSTYGYHIIKSNKIIKETTSLKDATESIKAQLQGEKISAEIEKLKKEAKVTKDEKALEKIKF